MRNGWWRTEVSAQIQSVYKKVDDLAAEVARGQKEAAARTEEVRVELTGKIDRVEAKVDNVKDLLHHAKIWALGLYGGLIALLFYALARGFKWV